MTRPRTVAALLMSSVLTLSACGGDEDSTAGIPDNTRTVSGPSASTSGATQSKDEPDMARAVKVTEAFYAENIGKDAAAPSTKYATQRYVDEVQAVLDTFDKTETYRGPKDKVLWVKPGTRSGTTPGKGSLSTHVCLENNRLLYNKDGKMIGTTIEGKPMKRGDTVQLLVTVSEEQWKVDGVKAEKTGCRE